MENNKIDLERQVFASLTELHQQYLKIDQLVDVILEKQARVQPVDVEMRLIAAAKNEVATMESAASEAKANYRRIPGSPSYEIKTLSAKSAQLLTKVIKKIESIENATKDSLQKLLPKIGKNVRTSEMQKAYGASE